MSRLWIRNLTGMSVVVAALAIIGVLDLYPQWSSYRHTVVPQQIIARNGSASAFGQTWRLGSIRRVATLPDRLLGAKVPQGATLAVVIIERSGPPAAQGCTGVLTDGRRRWRDQSASNLVYPEVAGATEFCSKPGPVQFNFLLPSNVTPTAIDITDASNAIVLRIQL
jgi:hypothetical protein